MLKKPNRTKANRTRLKKVHIHHGKIEAPALQMLPKPGTSIKIDDPNSPYWKREAMAKWGEYIHKKYETCIVENINCFGCLQAHHLIGRKDTVLRNHPENGVLLCDHHHNQSTVLSAHKGPKGFTSFLAHYYPEIANFIIENQHMTGKPNFRADYERLCKLEAKL